AQFGCGVARAAVPEDVLATPALRAHVVAHVLDQPEYGHLEFLEHGDGFRGHGQGQVLRGRDDHRAGERNGLREAQLNVARAGRQVHYQVIELAPAYFAQELLHGLVEHGPAPDHGFALGQEVGHRNNLDAVFDWRLDLALDHLGLLAAAHQHGDAGPVDVGVHEAH